MPEVRLLAPVTDNEGKPHAAGEVVDVEEEVANEWHAAGKASLVADEKAQADPAGHYSDVTGREDVAPLAPGSPQPGPQEETPDKDDDDRPRGKAKKK